MGLTLRKPEFIACKNKGTDSSADRPAHLCSLVYAFVFHSLKHILSKFASNIISLFYVVSIAVQTGLSLIWSKNAKDRFSYVVVQIRS